MYVTKMDARCLNEKNTANKLQNPSFHSWCWKIQMYRTVLNKIFLLQTLPKSTDQTILNMHYRVNLMETGVFESQNIIFFMY